MPFTFLSRTRPVSINNRKRKHKYQEKLASDMQKRYPLLADGKYYYEEEDKLYLLIVYLYKGDPIWDVDNVIKAIQDAFCKYLYNDDSQINCVISQKIDCSNNEYNAIDTTGLSDKDMVQISAFLKNPNRPFYFYIECGKSNSKFFNFNLEDKWK